MPGGGIAKGEYHYLRNSLGGFVRFGGFVRDRVVCTYSDVLSVGPPRILCGGGVVV